MVLFSSDADELTEMIQELKKAPEATGLKMNLRKTKIMSHIDILVTNHILEVVQDYCTWDILSSWGRTTRGQRSPEVSVWYWRLSVDSAMSKKFP